MYLIDNAFEKQLEQDILSKVSDEKFVTSAQVMQQSKLSKDAAAAFLEIFTQMGKLTVYERGGEREYYQNIF